ncbi:MAG: tetratricopeptide repeat protein, partial [Aggregatilineales bacterium]
MAYSPMELAEAFIQTGELDDALEALAEQIDTEPKDFDARRLRASVLLRLPTDENIAQGIADMDVIPVKKRTGHDYWLRSLLFEKQGNIAGALVEAQLAELPDARGDRLTERIIEMWIAMKNYEGALDVIAQQPRNRIWREREADIYVLMGDDIKAMKAYNFVLAEMVEDFDLEHNGHHRARYARVLMAHAAVCQRIGDIYTARDTYAEASAYIDDPVLDFNRGLLAATMGEMDKATELCSKGFNAASERVRAEMREDLVHEKYTTLRRRLFA